MFEVTICVPHYRSDPALLRRCLASIAGQTSNSWTVLLADDGSGDGPWWEVIEAFCSTCSPGQVVVLRGEANLGFVANSNVCLDRVETPYVAFLHQDDAWEPAFLETVARSLREEPRAVVAFSDTTGITSTGELLSALRLPGPEVARFWPGPELASLLLDGLPIQMCSVVFRTDAGRAVGGLDPRFPYVADWHFWLRLLELGGAVRTPESLALFGQHADKLSWKLESSGAAQRDIRRLLAWAHTRPWAREARRRAELRCAARFLRLSLVRGRRGNWRAARPYVTESVRLLALAAIGPTRRPRSLRTA